MKRSVLEGMLTARLKLCHIPHSAIQGEPDRGSKGVPQEQDQALMTVHVPRRD
ncbi:MAG: hypothetical protein QXQ39_05125 [Conexivisphaerales archaeon]